MPSLDEVKTAIARFSSAEFDRSIYPLAEDEAVEAFIALDTQMEQRKARGDAMYSNPEHREDSDRILQRWQEKRDATREHIQARLSKQLKIKPVNFAPLARPQKRDPLEPDGKPRNAGF